MRAHVTLDGVRARWSNWSSRYDLNARMAVLVGAIALFFLLFLIYPVAYILREGFFLGGNFSIGFFRLDRQELIEIFNSTFLAVATTFTTTLLSLPLAYLMTRFRFPFKGILHGVILIPMIMPPFVGAVGIRQMFAQFGAVNMFIIKIGTFFDSLDGVRDGALSLGLVRLAVPTFENAIDWFGATDLHGVNGHRQQTLNSHGNSFWTPL